ncbi:MAG: ABC transporter permease [Alphaproteobacteria bacterium]|nr:ABC transporter permease [Alphaproteobacteria bacterium]
MYGIALRMLLGDRGKYIGMVIGIAFASLIMSQQPAIFFGLVSRTYSFVKDISLPDIWVMDPGVQFVEEHKPLRNTELSRIRGIKGVAWAVPLYKSLVRARMPDGYSKTVDLTGLDDGTLVGAPYKIIGTDITDFRRQDAVFVDKEAAQSRLRVNLKDGTTRPLLIGDVLELNDKRALVVGYVKTTRNFVLQPQVYTTYSRAMSYTPPDRKQLTYVLVKAVQGVDLLQLCRDIEQTTGLRALDAKTFEDVNLNYWMKNTGIPINFGISVLLGFIVGAAVVGQTFYNFVQENIKHYASLKAMGLSASVLVRMVLLQAFFVGTIGYGIGVGLTSLFGIYFHDSVLAFRMPLWLMLFSAIGVLTIVLLAAFLGLRRVLKVDPSVVFRN